MSEAFLGEIRMFSFDFPPKGWASCNGQLLAINNNQALFALLGTNYGGNGQTTFALPDLRGRVPMHTLTGNPGQRGGAVSHTLTSAEMPAHSHVLLAEAPGNPAYTPAPGGAVLSSVPAGAINMFSPADGSAAMSAAALAPVGGGQPHNNMQPYATSMFAICLAGIFPSHF